MIGLPPINRRPVGFLSLLGLQQQGVAPGTAGQTVQPVLDMLGFYLAGDLVRRNVQISIAAVGFTGGASPLVVPFGELWIVSSFSGQSLAAVGAGNSFTASIATFDNYWPSGTSGRIVGSPMAVATGQIWGAASPVGAPWIARAGLVFGTACHVRAGAAETVELCVEYLALKT